MAELNHDELVRAFTAASIAANERARSEKEAKEAQDDYARAAQQAAEEIEASSKKTKQALTDLSMSLGKSAVDLGQAMITGSEGTTKYAGAVQGAADAAGNAATALMGFGPLGIIVGGVIKAFGALVGASLKQNDTLMKSYRELSDIGSVSGSLEKLQTDLNRVGLTSEEAEKFGKLLGKTAPDLAAFGGSVSSGKDKFIGVFEGMIGVGNKTEIAMARIGYSAEDMRDATADYVAKQSRLGLAQGKTAEQLRQESTKYMVTLRELGELTGMSRDEAQKLMDQQQADARWGMTLRQMELEGKGDEAKKLQAYMATYEKTFGKDAAQGLMEQIANKGAIVGEASAKAYTSTQGKAYEEAMRVAKGQASMQEGLSQTAAGVRKNLDQVGSSLMIAGRGAEGVTGSYEQINGAMALENKKNIDIQGKLAETQQNGGKLLNANIDLEQRNRQMRIMADKALMEVTGVTVSVFQKLNEVVFSLGKNIAKLIDWMSGVIPGMKKTNFSEQFKDKDDHQGDVNVAKNALAESERQKAELQKDIAKYSQDASGKTLQAAIDAAKKGAQENRVVTDQFGTVESGDAQAAELYQTEVKRLEELQKQIAKKDGTIDAEKAQQVQKDKLLVIEQKILDEKQKLVEAEKKMKAFMTTTGGGSGAGGTASASAGAGGGGASGGGGSAPSTSEAGSPASRVTPKHGPAGGHASEGGGDKDSKPKLAQISSKTGKSTAVNEKYAPAFQSLIDYLDKEGYEINSLGGYVDRDVRGQPGVKSVHAQGGAIDINPSTNPMGSTLVTDMPANISAIAAGLGLGWGGNWKSSKDAMHFSAASNEGGKLFKAMDGGVFDGPIGGYPVELHGKNESVWPEKKLKEALSEVQKSSIEDYKKQIFDEMGLNSNSTAEPTTSASSSDSDATTRMIEVMTAKFDDMINQLEASNGTLRNLLTYAQA